ncbi:MAG TPA: hypothetical protein DIW81_09335, partial [Planctomycetaceae bacterium]|nr:hypothetical protein [Planctomycetaceae bacterium]
MDGSWERNLNHGQRNRKENGEMKCWSFVLLVLLLPSTICADDFFTSKIEPLFRERCFECHSHEYSIEAGLALDSRSG